MENKINFNFGGGKLIIIGCGGHARSVASVVLQNFPDAKIIFVDENAQDNERIFNFPVVRTLPQDAQNIFVAIGDNASDFF